MPPLFNRHFRSTRQSKHETEKHKTEQTRNRVSCLFCLVLLLLTSQASCFFVAPQPRHRCAPNLRSIGDNYLLCSKSILLPSQLGRRVGGRSLRLRHVGAADSGAESSRASKFERWLAQRGCKGIGSTIRVGKSNVGGWGLFAARNIRKGEVVLAIPLRSLSLSEESVNYHFGHLSDHFDRISEELCSLYGFSCDTPHGDPFITIQLLLHAQDGDASEWAPYISMLPRERRAGWGWDAELGQVIITAFSHPYD